MSDPEAIVSLPDVEPSRLAAAVHAAVTSRAELAAQLRAGAEQSMRDEPSDVTVARRFQALLELGYLVASADGFADEERASLARLLEGVTSAAIDHDVLELHFRDLDEAVAALGRRERLARAAADLKDPAEVEEAIALVAIIAMADGCLSAAEHDVLVELGEHLKVKPSRVFSLVEDAAARVKDGLA